MHRHEATQNAHKELRHLLGFFRADASGAVAEEAEVLAQKHCREIARAVAGQHEHGLAMAARQAREPWQIEHQPWQLEQAADFTIEAGRRRRLDYIKNLFYSGRHITECPPPRGSEDRQTARRRAAAF